MQPPYNLLLNTAFKYNTDNWSIIKPTSSAIVTIDNSMIYNNRNSLKIECFGLTSDGYTGPRQRIKCKSGDIITVSCYTYTDNRSNGLTERPSYIEVWFVSNGSRIAGSEVYINATPTSNNEWRFVMGYSKIAPANADSAEIVFHIARNGRIWLNGIKAEIGNNPYPKWTPNASETDNMLKNSAIGWNNSTYPNAKISLTEKPIDDEFYTITIWGEFGERQDHWEIFNSNDYVSLTYKGEIKQIGTNVYSGIFLWRTKAYGVTSANSTIWVYAMPGNAYGNTTASIIHKVKLEKGMNYNPVWTSNAADS